MSESKSPLVSVICPTRSRPAKFKRMIQSFLDNTHNPSNLQIVARIDEDDKDTLDMLKNGLGCLRGASMKVLIGPKYECDYDARISKLYWEACNAADGKWLFIMNDDGGLLPSDSVVFKDCEIQPWDLILEHAIVDEHRMIAPHMNRWNGNWYASQWHSWHFFMMPNKFWEEFKLTQFMSPLDTWLLNWLCGAGLFGDGVGLGWKIMPVRGLYTFHEQTTDQLFIDNNRTSYV